MISSPAVVYLRSPFRKAKTSLSHFTMEYAFFNTFSSLGLTTILDFYSHKGYKIIQAAVSTK